MSKKAVVSQEDMMKLLYVFYSRSLKGIPNVSPSVKQLADDYLKRYATKEAACDAMIKSQIIKCTTSGTVTSFGGLFTLPVTLPANITSVIYNQMRMVACIAYMNGYELESDQTKTFVYACLAGVAVSDCVRRASIQFGTKLSSKLIEKIPGKTLTAINQKVGFRFITKMGQKGIINIGKMVPVVSAVVGGGFDFLETKTIAERARNWFINADFTGEAENKNESSYVEVDDENIQNK